ncbi:hypothetical protein COR50_13880 [Chitinophaga caeni]|uniref:DUF4199 domain-containing protein n=1 Tax=Chitinophaga caeni TaxID=2029983 RepID=A0A291QWD3_9BACT|nr:DUF4199 domain-containing protein [Chitinophaga caeni]ATL48164.1 hypothetical protein COR50_13880 [Chitinophaga caeni]
MNQKIHIKYGLGTTLIGAILFSLFYFLDKQPDNNTFRGAFVVITMLGIILSTLQFSKQAEGKASFGALFSNGFRTTAVIIVLFIVFLLICVTIAPDLKAKILAEAAQADAGSHLSPEAIKEQQEFVSKQFIPFIFSGVLITLLIIGGFASLIGALIARKK